MSWRMASKTILNWLSYFFSKSSSLRERPAFDASISRSRTNVRMISTFTCTARLLFSSLESMATPYSVKA